MAAQRKSKGKTKKPQPPPSTARRLARILAGCVVLSQIALAALGDWFVHHPREWIAARPAFIARPLIAYGDPVGDFTDAIGLTGTDTIYEYDEDPPNGEVYFAGEPVRVGDPAPNDIQVLQRGNFAIGWSPSYRHPVWVAYHVPPRDTITAEPANPAQRPSFQKDRSVDSSPAANAYEGSGYDRGHLAPNYAFATRFGESERKRTFLMTNIVPQTPALNRGAWRDLEHRIADLWSGRYGEVWVIVGTVSGGEARPRLESGVELPDAFFQLVLAQTSDGLRALAVLLPQDISSHAYPTRYVVSIAELETMTGLNLLPNLPGFIAKPLKAQTPTRLWPVGLGGAIDLILSRFAN